MNEFENIVMTCSVNYSGNWVPSMSWQQDGGQIISDRSVNVRLVPYDSVTYSLTVTVTRNISGNKFFGRAYFDNANKPPGTTVNNIPSYSFIWTSPAVDVTCKFE